MTDVVDAGAFWDREIVEHTHGTSWMEHPLVSESIDRVFGGVSRGEWFIARLNGHTFERGLSIGCGGGHLERVAVGYGVCKRVDAFDGSVHSLRVARRAAEKEGYTGRIFYFASDFNRPALPPNAYDIVFFNQSLHHVGKLETLFRALLRAMKPDGVLYVDEYIGPSRTDWNDALIAPHRAAFAALPADVRKTDFVPLPIQADDPSEGIRSGEIMNQLAIGFDIEEQRDYGGNLLAVLDPLIDWTRAPPDLLSRLLEQDSAMAKSGSYYTLVVARPKRGLRRLYAAARWFLEPKVKRIAYEIRKHL